MTIIDLVPPEPPLAIDGPMVFVFWTFFLVMCGIVVDALRR